MKEHDFTLVLTTDPNEEEADKMHGQFNDGTISTIAGSIEEMMPYFDDASKRRMTKASAMPARRHSSIRTKIRMRQLDTFIESSYRLTYSTVLGIHLNTKYR